MGKNTISGVTAVMFGFGVVGCIRAEAGDAWKPAQWDRSPEVTHETMDIRIGYPAIISPGTASPSVVVYPAAAGTLTSMLRDAAGEPIQQPEPLRVAAGQPVTVAVDPVMQSGTYSIAITMAQDDGKTIEDIFYFTVLDSEALPDHYSRAAYPGPDGRMVYTPDYRGNRIPDFSAVGYMDGQDIPQDVPVIMELEPAAGDDTVRIQEAIDAVSRRPLDEQGFRGAVLLKAGIYEIEGVLHIRHSGVVLRGEGHGGFQKGVSPEPPGSLAVFKERIAEAPGTILLATGEDIRTLIEVSGSSGVQIDEGSVSEITDAYVPVGATYLHVTDATGFAVGDRIIVERSGNDKWIDAIGMSRIPPRRDGNPIRQWQPFNLRFENRIESMEGNRLGLRHPIMNAIERQYGGGRVYRYSEEGRISQVGIESMRAISIWEPCEHGKDHTRHAQSFIRMQNAKHAWVCSVVGEHFYGSVVIVGRGCRSVTVQHSAGLLAANEPYYSDKTDVVRGRVYLATGVYTGRSNFRVEGTRTLVRDIYAMNNRHAFWVGSRVNGPNVFVRGRAETEGRSLGSSEPHHRWAAGGLFDNVHDHILIGNRLWFGSGHGWSGANYVAWNTKGHLVAEQPPTAQNWAIGHVGSKGSGPHSRWNLAEFGVSDGYWESHDTHVEPQSLYQRQLEERRMD